MWSNWEKCKCLSSGYVVYIQLKKWYVKFGATDSLNNPHSIPIRQVKSLSSFGSLIIFVRHNKNIQQIFHSETLIMNAKDSKQLYYIKFCMSKPHQISEKYVTKW